MRDGFSRSMRPALLAGSFVALIAALAGFWAHRFERSPNMPVVRIADLHAVAPEIPGIEWLGAGNASSIRISAGAPDAPVAGRLSIPGIHSVDALHLRFRMTAGQLVPGPEIWEDGRFIIEWHPEDAAHGIAITPAGSIRFDSVNAIEEFVIPAPNAPARPTVRLENLGRSGSFEIADLEISAVRETRIWNLVKWPLVVGWFVWGIGFIRSWPQARMLPVAAASGVWVLMAIHFAVPGPWHHQRALVSEFKLGTGDSKAIPAAGLQTDPRIAPGPIPGLGKLKDQGSLPLRIKVNIAKARPILHILLFCMPTLVIAWLVGKKPAIWLMTILALGIESSQMAFGYGFDGIDILDLITDALGIALGIWLCNELRRRFGKRKHSEAV
jgi:hypothetical protein